MAGHKEAKWQPGSRAKIAPGAAGGASTGAKESSSTWQQGGGQNKESSSTWEKGGQNKEKWSPTKPERSQGQKGSTSSAATDAAAVDSGSWDSRWQDSTWKYWNSSKDENKDWKKWEEGKDWKAKEEGKDWKSWETVDQVHQQDPWKSGAGTSSSAVGHEESRSSKPGDAVAREDEDEQKKKESEFDGEDNTYGYYADPDAQPIPENDLDEEILRRYISEQPRDSFSVLAMRLHIDEKQNEGVCMATINLPAACGLRGTFESGHCASALGAKRQVCARVVQQLQEEGQVDAEGQPVTVVPLPAQADISWLE